MYGKVPYDPNKDFEAVSLVTTNDVALTVIPTFPARTIKDLVTLIRSNPGKYSYASAGTGTPSHLVGELFRQSLDLDLVHVPYNGAGPAIAAAVAGHTPISFAAVTPVVPQVREGRLRALALTRRLPTLPNVPTMAEVGYPDVDGENWSALLVPARTPKEIITTLHGEIVKVVALPDIRDRLEALGLEPVASTPDECATRFRAEGAKWARVIQTAGIRAE
jgi:tripartite-type tricarboxylate transporter receptor subunit TctC